jgi:peptidoglycan/LPS O-acetylase OafA/YrhL
MADHFDYLDSSRGFAALTVVFSHFFAAYGLFPVLSSFDNSVLHVMWHGDGAVDYFYVLSGFVLSIGFFKKKEQTENFNITGYLIRRIFRIFPLFLVSLLISYFLYRFYWIYNNNVFMSITPARSGWALALWPVGKTFMDVLKEGVLLFKLPSLTADHRFLPQDWTLQAELICSSIIPIAIVLFKKGKMWFLLFFVYVYFYSGNWVFIPFTFGIIIAAYAPLISDKIGRLNIYYVFLLLLAGLLLYTAKFNFLNNLIRYFPGLLFKFQSLGAAIFLTCLIGSSHLKKLFSRHLFVFLGRISYGIYLTHAFILIALVPLVLSILNTHGITGDYATRIVVLVFLVVTTIAISWFFYRTIEKPFNQLGKRIANHYFS